MMANPVPEAYRVDHLFLLVGTNPLPNYVAARLMLKEGGKVHLIHSEGPIGTERVARQLSAVLYGRGVATGSTIGVGEASAEDIFKKVSAVSRNLAKAVGLNYTGGTKSMAVHAYRALQARQPPTVFSYLDSTSMVMHIEPMRGERDPSVKVAGAVEPWIRELVALHGEPIYDHLPMQNVVLPELVAELAKACRLVEAAQEWRSWCNNELRRKAWSGKHPKPEGELQAMCLEWPTYPGLARFVTAFRHASDLADTPQLCLEPARVGLGLASCQDLVAWLDGDWLEFYVVRSAVALKEKGLIHDFGRTLDTNRRKAEHDFEMDVALMKGYQLYAIACTTSTSKSLCQSKLFEAVIRGKQLGGDESCIGLVCLYDGPEALRQKIIRFWQPSTKVRVFGPKDLEGLEGHLTRWVSAGGREG